MSEVSYIEKGGKAVPTLKSIRTVIFLSLIILFVCHKQILADQLGVPVVRNGQKYKYVVKMKKSGEVISHSEVIEYLLTEGGKKYFKIMGKEFIMDGRYNEETSVYEADNLLKLAIFKRISKTADGKVYEEFNKSFCEKSLNYPSDLYLADAHLSSVLKGLPFHREKNHFIHLEVNNKDVFKMKLKIVGRETINVPAGSFDCIKVKMKADTKSIIASEAPLIKAAAPFISLFVPTHHFWFTDDENHTFVKFEGVEGGSVFVRDIVMELEDIEAEQVPRNQE